MTPVEIIARVQERFGASLLEVFPEDKHPRVHVMTEHWWEIANFLRHNHELSFDWLSCLGGIDYAGDDRACVLYDFWSYERRHRIAVKVFAARATPVFPSVVKLWPTANWHEREAFDLFGYQFAGHPDLRRLLLAEDWEGHPLKKDYQFPREYQGIPGSVELDWKQHGG